jgi:hypothetical protein
MDKTLRPPTNVTVASRPADVLSEHMYWDDGSSLSGGVQTSSTMLKYCTKLSLGLLVPLRIYKTFLASCN